jgi:hypothetical protein
MEADYSVELGPAAPALELPWTDPEGGSRYVALRGGKDRPQASLENILDGIPEARQFPALRRFLALANSPQSAWQTAKCDVWAETAEAAENLYNAGFLQGGYVDLVLAEEAAEWRDSLAAHQRLAKEMTQRLEANQSLEACAEIVVRRCYFHRETKPEDSDAGYCLTLFLTGYGASPGEAARCWECTLQYSAECLLQLQPGKERA